MRSRGCPALFAGASGCVGHCNGLDEAGLARCGRPVDVVEAASNEGFSRTDGNDALSLAVAPSFHLPHPRKTISG